LRKTLILGAAIIALATSGCARRQAPPEAVPPAEQLPTGPGGEAVDPGDVELTELPAAQADLIAKAGSDTVYFGTDEYALDASAQATLAAQARWLLANPNVRASIEGHADERGTREYNMAFGGAPGQCRAGFPCRPGRAAAPAARHQLGQGTPRGARLQRGSLGPEPASGNGARQVTGGLPVS
jgi:hypothetical protein